MNVIAASTLAYLQHPLEEALKRIEAAGFEGVEVYHEGRHGLDARALAELLSTYSLKVFFHAPFSDLNLASFNTTVLSESRRLIKRSIEAAAKVGAEIVTVHFGRYSPVGLSFPEKAVERNRESVEEILSFAGAIGQEIAFENAPKGFGVMCGELNMLRRMREELEVKFTLDVGHAHTWSSDETEFIHALQGAIAHVHLHDNPGEMDLHLPIGEGGIDYRRVMRALSEINYKNALCLELHYEEGLERSLERLHALLAGD